MAIFSKPESFVKQISVFLSNKENQRAYELSTEMAATFPSEMISHFLLAKSALRLERYEEAAWHGKRAFDLSHERADLLGSAVLIATARFMLGEYEEGYKLLRIFEKDEDENVEEMLLMFSAVLGDSASAGKFARKLMKLNAKVAEELISAFLESSAPE